MPHAGVELDGMTLPSVLGDVGVDEVDDVSPDTGAEDSGQDELGLGLGDDVLSLLSERLVDVDNLPVDHVVTK